MKNRDVESEAAGRKSNIETDKQNISFLYLSEEDMIRCRSASSWKMR